MPNDNKLFYFHNEHTIYPPHEVRRSIGNGAYEIVAQTNDEKLARTLAAAEDSLKALISAMSFIPNPNDPEDSRAESLDEYYTVWTTLMHKNAKKVFDKVKCDK